MNKKIAVIPLLLFVLIIVLVVVVYMPVNKEMGNQKRGLAVLKEKQRHVISERQVRRMKGHIDSLQSRLDERIKRVYPKEKLLDLGRTVESIGKRFDLRLISIAPDYENLSLFKEDKEEISELSVTMQFQGSFIKLSRFLDAIPEFPIVIRVNEVAIEKENQNSARLDFKLRGVIVLRKEEAYESTKSQDITNRA